MAPRRAAPLAALALAALSAAAALTLGRVFDAGRFAAPVLGAAVAPHALGLLGRRFRWSIATTLLASFAGLVAYVAWAIVPGDTRYGIPTVSTFESIGVLLGDGFDALRTAKAPAPVTTGAILLAVVAVWVMAQIADLLAFHRHATIGAIAPALGLFVWASSLGTDTLALRSTVLFGAAALVFLLVQHQALLERQRARFSGRRLGAGSGLVALGALAIVVALVGGAALGPSLPGAEAGPLLDLKNLGDGDGDGGGDGSYETFPPLAIIGQNFTSSEEVEVFRVAAGREEYWRTSALDQYTSQEGGTWTLRAQGNEDGLDEDAGDEPLLQTFSITALDDIWLPAAYEPRSVSGTEVVVVPESGTLVAKSESSLGLTYTVESEVPAPAEEASEGERARTSEPYPESLRSATELPADFPMSVVQVAEDVTADAATPYDKAVALEDFFDPANGFTYSLDVDLSGTAQSASAIESFLQNRVGFCVQFAGSYAAMARAIGLPARVAVGFTPGTDTGRDRQFAVTGRDAHAWPEVYLSGMGWTRFEPTPPATDAAAGGSDLPGTGTGTETQGQPPPTTTVTTTPAPTAGATPGSSPGQDSEISIGAPAGGASDDVGGGLSLTLTVLLVAAALVVIGAVLGAIGVIVSKSRRRAERRARTDPAAAVAGAWEQLLDQLVEDGQTIDTARTPYELAATAAERIPASGQPLDDLARRYSDVRYGHTTTTPDEVQAAWQDVSDVETALSRVRSRWQRFRRRLDPSPLRSRR